MTTLADRVKLWVRFFTCISYPRDLPLVIHAFIRRRTFLIPEDTWKLVDPIGGFLSRKEAGLLHWAAREWDVEGPVIELGSFEGRSTIVFARAGRQVHAVDAWSLNVTDLSAFDAGRVSADRALVCFQGNLRRAHVGTQVHTHRGLTHDVGKHWNIPGAILFIDAGHTYADVKGDLDIWTPHLQRDGLLLVHDVLGDIFLDVTRAASELLGEDWRVEASAGSIVAFSRK